MSKYINTVPAENQMINSSELSFLGEENAPIKILVIGNSITRHGPNTDIGWLGDWGMSASAPEKDYVHRLYALLKASGKNVYMRIRQSAGWERKFTAPDCLIPFEADRAFDADILVYRLGENVAEEDVPAYKEAVRELVKYLCPNGRVVFTTNFWAHPKKDLAVQELAAEMGFSCADTACTDDSMMALGKFEHHGVSIHPGDQGMEMIAEKIYELI